MHVRRASAILALLVCTSACNQQPFATPPADSNRYQLEKDAQGNLVAPSVRSEAPEVTECEGAGANSLWADAPRHPLSELRDSAFQFHPMSDTAAFREHR